MGRKSHPAAGQPISLRIADDLRAELASAGQSLKMPDHEVMRLAMQIGLKHFAAINYDIAGAVLNQSNAAPKHQPQSVNAGPTAKAFAASPSNITLLPERNSIAAEEAATGTDNVPTPKPGNYNSGIRKHIKRKPKP